MQGRASPRTQDFSDRVAASLLRRWHWAVRYVQLPGAGRQLTGVGAGLQSLETRGLQVPPALKAQELGSYGGRRVPARG